MNINNFRLVIQYYGSGLHGWQAQQHTHLTVQTLIQNAIFQLTRTHVNITCAGRTDAGVHALHQVANFKSKCTYSPNSIRNALNHFLKETGIYIVECTQVDLDFNARYSAKYRHYVYYLSNQFSPILKSRIWHTKRNPDFELISKNIKQLEGNHDFSSFTCDKISRKNRTLDLASISNDCIFGIPVLRFEFKSKSFLHNQVRIMVGTLYEIGIGKKINIPYLFSNKSRCDAGITAPACGLYLKYIQY